MNDLPNNNNRSTPAQFRSKLGTYLSGVFIGFVLLGLIYYQKHLANKRIQAETESAVLLESQSNTSSTQSNSPTTEAKP
jgi:hypothetical protein